MASKDDILTRIGSTAVNHTAASDELERLIPSRPDTSVLTLACSPADYSASLIARAVEDCDAHLLNLNLTSATTPSGLAVVEIRVSHTDPSSVARSLERYGYEVIGTKSDMPVDDDNARSRAREFLHYLSV